MTSDTISQALAYAARGWPVFPCGWQGERRKQPLTQRGFLDASRDPSVIETWWCRWPEANIGLPTGAVSNFDALDIDPRHGGDESLAALEAEHGALPFTIRAFTGGGGNHVLFRHRSGITNARGGLPAGIDVRGDGGYILAAPSVHPSGRVYAWDADAHPDETELAGWPEWLFALILTAPFRRRAPELPESWRRLVADGVSEGRRNEAIARLAGHLLRKYIDPYVALDLCRAWNICRCCPPLPDHEVTRTVESIATRELRRRGGADA
jgi:hypothetical protein